MGDFNTRHKRLHDSNNRLESHSLGSWVGCKGCRSRTQGLCFASAHTDTNTCLIRQQIYSYDESPVVNDLAGATPWRVRPA